MPALREEWHFLRFVDGKFDEGYARRDGTWRAASEVEMQRQYVDDDVEMLVNLPLLLVRRIEPRGSSWFGSMLQVYINTELLDD